MKIEMKTLYCTPERTVQPGQVAQFPNDEAETLIERGFAVPVDEEGQGTVRTRPVAQPAKRGGRGKQQPADAPPPVDPPTPKE